MRAGRCQAYGDTKNQPKVPSRFREPDPHVAHSIVWQGLIHI